VVIGLKELSPYKVEKTNEGITVTIDKVPEVLDAPKIHKKTRHVDG